MFINYARPILRNIEIFVKPSLRSKKKNLDVFKKAFFASSKGFFNFHSPNFYFLKEVKLYKTFFCFLQKPFFAYYSLLKVLKMLSFLNVCAFWARIPFIAWADKSMFPMLYIKIRVFKFSLRFRVAALEIRCTTFRKFEKRVLKVCEAYIAV